MLPDMLLVGVRWYVAYPSLAPWTSRGRRLISCGRSSGTSNHNIVVQDHRVVKRVTRPM